MSKKVESEEFFFFVIIIFKSVRSYCSLGFRSFLIFLKLEIGYWDDCFWLGVIVGVVRKWYFFIVVF